MGDDMRAWLYARADAARGVFSCVFCGLRLVRTSLATRCPHERIATLDHLTPRLRGGSNTPANLVVACLRCNRGKGEEPLSAPGLVAADIAHELTCLPTPETLAHWRRRILTRAQQAAPGAARWGRLLSSPAWSSTTPLSRLYDARECGAVALAILLEGRAGGRQGEAREACPA